MTVRFVTVAIAATLMGACGAANSTVGSQPAGPAIVDLSSVKSQVEGKPAVYLFTAPGCVSCADQARALANAAQRRPSVRLVGVDLTNDTRSTFAAWVREIGLSESPFVWTIDSDGSLARRYGIASLSSTVFVGSDGRIRFTNQGPADPPTLSNQLSQLS
jgi:thiol-disulfide isomerase/thioredoxin